MRIEATPLAGVMLLRPERFEDERGWFARTYDADLFRAHGLEPGVVQMNASFNARAGTIRGMHWQADPHGERKVIRCTRGRAHDVLVDLRDDSPTRGQWFAHELSPESGDALYVPEGIAHGFQTLAHDTQLDYLMGSVYVPDAARGVRWDDPAFAIDWPHEVTVISDRDRSFPDWSP